MNITEYILLFGWIFVLIWVPVVIATNRKTHPGALFVLFGAEMWERFSYYGMRALLTLYMVKVLFVDMGAAADARALGIYGSYTSMVYLFPVVGGLIADRVFGFRKAILVGGIIMMLGHFALALEGMLFEGNMALFAGSLALIIIGNGYFKPNISSYLGTFYTTDDPRKDGAYTIFYMGVNIGAFLSSLTCGYVGENIGWHYGFGLAGIGMGLGLIVFWTVGKKVFGSSGLEPDPVAARRPALGPLSPNVLVWGGTLLMLPICAALLSLDQLMSTLLLIIALGIVPTWSSRPCVSARRATSRSPRRSRRRPPPGPTSWRARPCSPTASRATACSWSWCSSSSTPCSGPCSSRPEARSHCSPSATSTATSSAAKSRPRSSRA